MGNRIGREELKAKLDNGEKVILVEALPASYYYQEHLPGALNLPHDQVNELAPTLLPDKSSEIVTYCANGPCPNSAVAAQRLQALGYTNVREYYEGKQDWIEAGLPTESGAPNTLQPESFQAAKVSDSNGSPDGGMSSISTRERVEQLISYVVQGKIIDAVNEFYADDVVMQENSNEPTVGKAANLLREEGFVDAVAQVHESRATSVLVDGDYAAIHWIMDFTNTSGQRIRLDQIAQQTWQDGQIVQERFFYDSAAVAVN
jgi:rhodanese-related sulfurtransferase/ketosteroid isomerase-like protein